MARQTRAGKQADKAIEAAWYRLARGVQVSLMDIPAIFRAIRTDVGRGIELDAATHAAIATYRQN